MGGVIGPVLMLLGLARISALSGSLLLNLEAVFTIVLAVIIFHEHLSRRSAFASVLVVSGAKLLSYQPGPIGGGFLGVMAIIGACLSWAIDNNVSQRLFVRDPVAIVQVKTVGAGVISLVLALTTGGALPTPTLLVGGLALGSLSYGTSPDLCDAGVAASWSCQGSGGFRPHHSLEPHCLSRFLGCYRQPGRCSE